MELLTAKQVAQRLQITEQAVYLAIREGRLNSVTILGRIGITKTDYEAFKRIRRNGTNRKAA